MRKSRRFWIVIFVFFFLPGPAHAFANLEKSIAKLKPHTFCVNADLQRTWEAVGNILGRLEITTALADSNYHVIATDFIEADYGKLFKIANNPRPMAKGRFTAKISLEAVTPAFTRLHIILQVRQYKMFSQKESLLSSRGNFEKYLAYLIDGEAISNQYPDLHEVRLGMSFIPDLKTERYRIMDVEPDSPAADSLFKEGDRLISIAGREITIRGELFDELLSPHPSRLVEVDIERSGSGRMKRALWILRVKDKNADLGVKWNFDGKRRALNVARVTVDSRAERAGLQKGDVLLEVAGQRVENFSDYYRALSNLLTVGAPLPISVERGSEKKDLVLP